VYLILEKKGIWMGVKVEIWDNRIENGDVFVYCRIVKEFDRVAMPAIWVLIIDHKFIFR